MSAFTLLSLAAIAAPAFAQQGAYFVLGGGGMPVSIERVDPIISPGTISGHVHSVVGGNGFAPTMDFAQTQKSTCSTVSPKADKSNYWMPNLYFQDPKNGSFIRVPERPEHKIYYKYGTGENTLDKDRTEFPKEFRMIAGNAMQRSDNATLLGTGGTQLNWMCHKPNYDIISATGFPTGFTECEDGFAATMRLPSCWSGRDYDPKDPTGHVAYPLQGDGLAGCPAGFQKARFPEIMVEYWFELGSFTGLYGAGDSPWVLSNGDPTGYAFHLDFINGWETGVLDSIMPTCRPGNTGTPPLSDATCFGKAGAGGTYTSDEMNSCRKKPSFDEDVGYTYGTMDGNRYDGTFSTGGVLDALPGCNPIQAGPAAAVKKTCGDETSPASASSAPATSYAASSTAGAGAGSMSASAPTTLATSMVASSEAASSMGATSEAATSDAMTAPAASASASSSDSVPTTVPAASASASAESSSTSAATKPTHVKPSHVKPSHVAPSHIHSYPASAPKTTPAAAEGTAPASAPVYSIMPVSEGMPSSSSLPDLPVTSTFTTLPAASAEASVFPSASATGEQDDCGAD